MNFSRPYTTKSDNYIPTHFLYSSLLFFLLIFMHQQTYCHTLLQPFFKIFLFRIYAPTIHSTDFELDETSDRLTHISRAHPAIHKPIHQRHSPPNFHANTATTNQSTNDHRRTNQTTDTTLPQIPPYTLHKYHNHTVPQTHTASTNTQPHKHRHPLDASPPTDADVDVDADAQTLTQHRCTRSHAPVRNWTGQADRIRPYKTRPDRIRPPIHN